jgi:hypothetical protein
MDTVTAIFFNKARCILCVLEAVMSDLFDDLRSDGSSTMNFEEEGGSTTASRFNDFSSYEDLDDDPRPREEQRRRRGRKGKHFLGMTPGQRLILVFLIFVLSLIFSSACLILTQTIVIV